jgi:diguanylate cyclase (GGDEF)-like protein
MNRARSWSVLLAALLVGAFATYGILRLHGRAADHSAASLLVSEIEAGARHHSAAEWEAVAEAQLEEAEEGAEEGEETEEEDPRQVEADLERSVDRLLRAEAVDGLGGAEYARAVDDAFRGYRAAVRRQFTPLADGGVGVAPGEDEQHIDPAYDRLSEALAAARAYYGDSARSATRTANVGTVVLLALAGAIIGLMVWRFQRVSAKAAALLEHQSLHDPLTALPNRRLFAEHLRAALARADRRREPVFVLYLDLDDFKVVNDSLGHQTGDRLLLAVCERLRTCLRPGDTAARMGGDEFTVLLADVTRPEDAIRVADRLARKLKAPFRLGSHEVVVNASVGIASRLNGQDTAEDLLRRADVAMYDAKKRGKGQYRLFDPEMDTYASERLRLESDLRAAVRRDEFRLFFQPIVDLNSGAITELEALVRWDHSRKGLIAPGGFIRLAEETGLIVPLGLWTLTEACRQAAAWRAAGRRQPAPAVSANLSARQLLQPDLVETVAQTLRETGLDPDHLRLEITETSMIQDPDLATATLRALRALGVHLVVDDFGTGFSTLTSVKHLPVECLKIDRSFVDGLGDDAQDTAIVHAVIAFAKTLRLEVTAEGIETAEQLEQLRALGCDRGQGYYFARPMPARELAAFLDAHDAELGAEPWPDSERADV